MVADSVKVLTSNDPTVLRINKIVGNQIYYKIKMYNEYSFSSAIVLIDDCGVGNLSQTLSLDIASALSIDGYNNSVILEELPEYVCLQLIDVKDAYDNDLTINSYHKIKLN